MTCSAYVDTIKYICTAACACVYMCVNMYKCVRTHTTGYMLLCSTSECLPKLETIFKFNVKMNFMTN